MIIIHENIISNHYTSINDVIKFNTNSYFNFQNFSVLTTLAIIFKYIFKINDENLSTYLFWHQLITYIVIFSAIITGVFFDRINRKKVTLLPIIVFLAGFFNVLSFMFYDSPTVGNSWVLMLIVLFCYLLISLKHFNSFQSSNISLILILSVSGLNINLTIITILMMIFNLYYAIIKNNDPINQSIYCIAPFAYVIFIWIPLQNVYVYTIILCSLIVLSMMIYILWFNNKFTFIVNKLNKFIVANYKFICAVFLLCIYFISLILLFTYFKYEFVLDLWPDNKTYENIWNIFIGQDGNWKLNLTTWCAYAFFFMVSLFYIIVKKIKLSTQPLLLFFYFLVLVFINPLSLNLFLRLDITGLTYIDFGSINFLVIVPIMLWLSGKIMNLKVFVDRKELINGQYIRAH